MPMRRCLIVLVFTVCYSCGTEETNYRSEATSRNLRNRDAAISTAVNFVNDYVTYNDSAGVRASPKDWLAAQPNVTEMFKQKLKEVVDAAQVQESGLDADPILNAQDFPERGFEFDSSDSTAKFIVVRAIGQPEFKVTVKVIGQQGKFWVDGCGVVNVLE